MESTRKFYSFNRSLERLDNILDSSNNNYEEKDHIPARSRLTYTNGFYVNVSAIFVDIRDSSSLSDNYYRPTLAKIEVVAIMNGDIYCQEINIIGDCVSGIFETEKEEGKNSLIETVLKINGIIRILNCKLSKKNIEPINVGIGLDYGRALMIKAGNSGSEINEIVWMGDVVNNASKLCDNANSYRAEPILISNELYYKLPSKKRILFEKNYIEDCYECDEIDSEMEEWIEENCGD